MKKSVSILILTALCAALFAGCGQTIEDRILYKDAKLSEIVKLGEYKNIPVDTSDDSFKEYYDDVIEADIDQNEFYTYEEKKQGKVENGDIANIDYTGKRDGVAFEGGTAKGSDLEIGSHSFIDGFEDGLIGVNIGDTVDLNLTFPENYGNDLAGADVVFKVKVNSAKKKLKETPEEYYSKLNYKSADEYIEASTKKAVKNYLYDAVCKNSEIKEYPQADIDIIYNVAKNAVAMNIQSQYNMSFEDYLSSAGQTEEQFKEYMVEQQIKNTMASQMVLYAILDKEKIKVEKSDIDAALKAEIAAIGNSSVTEETVKEFYGDYYFESAAVSDKVTEFLYNNAAVK